MEAVTVVRSAGTGSIDQGRSRGGEWLPSNVTTYSEVADRESAAPASTGEDQSGSHISRRALVWTVAATALASGAAGSALGNMVAAVPARRAGSNAALPASMAASPPAVAGEPVAAADLTAL